MLRCKRQWFHGELVECDTEKKNTIEGRCSMEKSQGPEEGFEVVEKNNDNGQKGSSMVMMPMITRKRWDEGLDARTRSLGSAIAPL